MICMSTPRRQVTPRLTVVPVAGMLETSSVTSCCHTAIRAAELVKGLNFRPTSLQVLIESLYAAWPVVMADSNS